MNEDTREITDIILAAADKARADTAGIEDPAPVAKVDWPLSCTVGPGLEGAIACESKIGYVNGAKGWLIYRGYDIFDLAAHSCFEEVAFLLLNGAVPSRSELAAFRRELNSFLHIPRTKRQLIAYPVEEMSPMAAIRFGLDLMRQSQTYRDAPDALPSGPPIASDEDSIPMETVPRGEQKAIYEFKGRAVKKKSRKAADASRDLLGAEDLESCCRLISGICTLTATVARVRQNRMPLEPDPDLGHAANLLYMITGRRPTPEEARIMDVALILHADHGMNASTFAALVVASTLSDIYFSIGAGVAALSGPLHGGANEQAVYMLEEIGGPSKVKPWYKEARAENRKIMGIGHRVYKAYDPRARVLGPLAEYLASKNKNIATLYATAKALETQAAADLGKDKKLFPNVDFYSGIVYAGLGVSPELFTPLFAVSRVAGWTARVFEYLQHNRIFRPRAIYTGDFNKRLKR
jgi:citrate synthase